MTTTKQYNYCLDFIKGIACIFVVFMHCEFPGLMGTAIQAISRFCIPFFFMVSGYFCFRPILQNVECQINIDSDKRDDCQRIRKKVLHIAKITLFATLFYLAFVLILQAIFHNQTLTITKKQLLSWVVFNTPKVIAGQYWFLFALLYVYIVYGVLERFNMRKFAYIMAAVLFVVYICLAQGAHIADIMVPNKFYRNWLIEAFPYFMLGHWIHEYQDEIHISNKALIAIIIVTTLSCWLERWIMKRDFGVNIVTIPQVFALFVYGVKNPTKHESAMQRFGRDCSMLVYIIHPAIWHTLDIVYLQCGIYDSTLAQYLEPLLVLGISIFLAIACNYLTAHIQIRRQGV